MKKIIEIIFIFIVINDIKKRNWWNEKKIFKCVVNVNVLIL